MKDATGPCTACERIASIEAMLDTLAERITRRNQGTSCPWLVSLLPGRPLPWHRGQLPPCGGAGPSA